TVNGSPISPLRVTSEKVSETLPSEENHEQPELTAATANATARRTAVSVFDINRSPPASGEPHWPPVGHSPDRRKLPVERPDARGRFRAGGNNQVGVGEIGCVVPVLLQPLETLRDSVLGLTQRIELEDAFLKKELKSFAQITGRQQKQSLG